MGFNPLPSPKQGETSGADKDRTEGTLVSIRSPHQSKGRPCNAGWGGDKHWCFNPLPSPKQGETHAQKAQAQAAPPFQSAPLTKARGDPPGLIGLEVYQNVSIRSPHQSKGRPSTNAGGGVPGLFQSAPLTKARGDVVAEQGYHRGGVSIRSPHQSKGRRRTRLRLRATTFVSIRSPHQSKGRPT